jgi:protein TonB
MPPIVKDSETAVATQTSAAPATTVTKTRDESPARPQPVALEIPVTVNGARTVEGSEKREPFSESTQTVLVFVHGAVIRLASSLAPGQLVFLTNEKTKKEVVCQVVKSKNYRSVTGYVELEFTEPALGFWGMRFPSDRIAPVTTTAPAPSAAPSAAPAAPRAAAPIVSAPPKAVPLPPSVPSVIPKPVAPVASVSLTPSVPVPPKPALVAPPAVAVVEPAPALAVAIAPIIPLAPQPAAPISPAPVNDVAPPPEALPATVVSVIKSPVNLLNPSPNFAAAISSLFEAPALPAVKPASTETPKNEVAAAPAQPSSDQLKQQTARLQEQLSSLLFTETSATPPPPVPAVTPKAAVPLPEVADKPLQLAQPDVKPTTPQEIKPAVPIRNFVPPSLAVEEVKIPSWLAPLARESEATTAEAAPQLPAVSDAFPASLSSSEEALTETLPDTHHRSPSAVFGGQLLGESGAAIPAPASSSRKGLFIGIAATLILAAGAVWYTRQPNNVISSVLASKLVPAQAPKFAPTSVPTRNVQPAAPVSASIVNPSPSPASSSVSPSEPPAHAAVAPAPPPVVTVKNPSTASHNAPPVEQPKKPAIGEVHLATPVVNRADGSQPGNDAEPTIDSNQTSNADPLASLAAGNNKEPIAPLPVGGDVKQARLLKSVPPVYPSAARTQHLSGVVKIDALIDATGNVSTVKVISGPGLLHQAALEAVKQWKYEPAELDGKPTPVHLTVTLQFRGQ